MAAASGLDKFRFMDDLAKLDPELASNLANRTNNGTNENPASPNSGQNLTASGHNAAAAAAAAAAATATRLLSLQRDLSGPASSPMDFLKQLEASSRNRGGFDRLMSLAGFGFPGLTAAGLPPLTPLSPPTSGPQSGPENELLKSPTEDSDVLDARLQTSEKQLGKSVMNMIFKLFALLNSLLN